MRRDCSALMGVVTPSFVWAILLMLLFAYKLELVADRRAGSTKG